MIYPHVVVWRERSAQNLRGDSVLAADVEIRGFYQQNRRLVRTERSEEIVSEALVFVPLEYAVKEGDQLFYGGKTYEVKKSDVVTDGVGQPHHLEVRL
jgi:hypothetical protein